MHCSVSVDDTVLDEHEPEQGILLPTHVPCASTAPGQATAPVADAVSEAETERELLPEADVEGESDELPVSDGDTEGEALRELVVLAVAAALALTLRDADGDGTLADGDALAVLVPVPVDVTDGDMGRGLAVGVVDGVAETLGVTSGCGCGLGNA